MDLLEADDGAASSCDDEMQQLIGDATAAGPETPERRRLAPLGSLGPLPGAISSPSKLGPLPGQLPDAGGGPESPLAAKYHQPLQLPSMLPSPLPLPAGGPGAANCDDLERLIGVEQLYNIASAEGPYEAWEEKKPPAAARREAPPEATITHRKTSLDPMAVREVFERRHALQLLGDEKNIAEPLHSRSDLTNGLVELRRKEHQSWGAVLSPMLTHLGLLQRAGGPAGAGEI